jgi:Fe-S-cluster containining protein
MSTFENLKERVYLSKMNSLKCKGLCQKSCGPIQIRGKQIVEDIKKYCTEHNITYHELPDHITPNEYEKLMKTEDKDLVCPYLKDGKCSIYPVRPMICKLWGAVQAMQCVYGCVPEKGLLQNTEGFFMLKRERER